MISCQSQSLQEVCHWRLHVLSSLLLSAPTCRSFHSSGPFCCDGKSATDAAYHFASTDKIATACGLAFLVPAWHFHGAGALHHPFSRVVFTKWSLLLCNPGLHLSRGCVQEKYLHQCYMAELMLDPVAATGRFLLIVARTLAEPEKIPDLWKKTHRREISPGKTSLEVLIHNASTCGMSETCFERASGRKKQAPTSVLRDAGWIQIAQNRFSWKQCEAASLCTFTLVVQTCGFDPWDSVACQRVRERDEKDIN